jgi:hypothetical protein
MKQQRKHWEKKRIKKEENNFLGYRNRKRKAK